MQELQVWQRAMAFSSEVSAILGRSDLRRDRVLSDQLNASSISIPSNIAEGYAQKTDRAFAQHLYIARGSAAEARTQLEIARNRGYLSAEGFTRLDTLAEEVARMLTGLIRHLLREDRRCRG